MSQNNPFDDWFKFDGNTNENHQTINNDDNPFLKFDQVSHNVSEFPNNLSLTETNLPDKSGKISLSPDSKSPLLELTSNVSETTSPRDKSSIISPTAAIEIPEWWGHSLDSPINNTATFHRWGDDVDPFATTSPVSPMTVTTDDINNQNSPNSKSSTQTSKGLIDPPRKKNEIQFKQKQPKLKPSTSNRSNDDKSSENNSLFFFPEENSNMQQKKTTSSQPNSPQKLSESEDETKNNKKADDKDNINSIDNHKKDNGKRNEENTENSGKKKDESSGKRRRPKTDAVAEMKRGATMLKYGRRGFPHFRRFQLSRDNTKLLWYSQKKKLQETNIAVQDIREVLQGQQTEVFKQCSQRSLEQASFSIVYGAKSKTLDLVAKSHEEALLWVKGFRGLLKARDHGKLEKVVQILVDVNYTDMTKPKYRQLENDQTFINKNEIARQFDDNPELALVIDQTLQASRKTFDDLVKSVRHEDIIKSCEYENVSVLISEIEQRLEDLQFALTHKTIELTELKRDVWVVKVDITVLDEKLKVLITNRNVLDLY